ncbi:MAG: OmpA family protein [Proteobacteria bacterium]|nr:OmpA family protein [Pseudomonadota bacterium]MDA1357686.1 OmpA family protein [Pseudomonadota bacterium]
MSAPNPYTIVSAQKIGRVVIYIARIFSDKAATAFAAARSFFILPALLLSALSLLVLWLAPANSVFAQDTVFIGGSGQNGFEIDLGALDHFSSPRGTDRGLRHPGVAGGGLAPVTLRPPGEPPRADSARATAPEPKPTKPAKPAKMVTKLETPATVAPATVAPTMVAPTLDAPALEAVATPKLAAPAPAPGPVLAKAPENMTAEERAAAKKRNKNSVSSTSFADEAALLDLDAPSAAKTKPAAQPKAATAAKPKAQPKSEAKAETKAAPETVLVALDPPTAQTNPVAPSVPGETMQILFGAGDSALPKTAQAPLATLASALGQDETLRLQLKAYAGGGDDSASQARRLSLSRALAVRSELIEQGVRSTRIDVRALGNKSEDGTSDRVDVVLVQR